MAKILNHPRVYAFLHVPVQSASDSVLMDMKREYCVDDFKQVVDFLKERWDRFPVLVLCLTPGQVDPVVADKNAHFKGMKKQEREREREEFLQFDGTLYGRAS